MKQYLRLGNFIFFVMGVFLLLVNIYGSFTSLRSPGLETDLNKIHPGNIYITPDQVYTILDENAENRKVYLRDVTTAIHNGIGHYWEDDGKEKFNLRVPFQENYILFLAGLLYPEKFSKYEFNDYRRGIERGVGLCSQHAIILSEALYDRGIKTKMIGLSGHVVAMVQIDELADEWWIADADYGVVVPLNITEVEKNPSMIYPYYAEKGYSQSTIHNLERIYGVEGNFIADGYGIGNYSFFRNYFEKAAYLLIWILPILLMIPLVKSIILRFRTR